MITGPASLFPSEARVRTLAVAGARRLTSASPTAAGRFRDAAFLPASSRAARARRIALRVWFAAGLAPVARGSADETTLQALAEIRTLLGGFDRFVVRLGTPGAASKATLVLLSPTGDVLGYAKVAWTPEGRRLVHNEARVLPLVGDDGPRLVGQVETDDVSAIVLSPLPGRELPLRAGVPSILADRACTDSARICVSEHPFVTDLAGRDLRLTERAVSLLGRRELAVACAHGDAAPWNALRGEDGVVRLMDWEYGRAEGLPAADCAHWTLQVSHLSLRLTPDRAVMRALCELADRLGLDLPEASGICALAAIDVCTRLEAEGNDAAARWWRDCATEAIARGLEDSRS